jgi:hypothetical protein
MTPSITLCWLLAVTPLVASTVPHEVLAYYYPWYGLASSGDHGNHWGKINAAEHRAAEALHFPEAGVYSSRDPVLVQQHILGARSNGITGFIASWWGEDSYEDRSLPLLFEKAANADFKVSVFWEKAPGKGQAQTDQAVSDLTHILTRFGTNKAFLKVEGKPVVFVYERVTSEIPENAWSTITSRARAKAGPFLLIGDGYDEKHVKLFNGIARYNISWGVAGKRIPALREWAGKFDQRAVQLARQHGRISCATVIPGYDDTKVRKPGRIADRQDGQVYATLWEEATKAKPDWIVVTSWNEWHEGTEVEPSYEDHGKYLKLTSDWSRLFLEKPMPGSGTH